MRRVGRAVAVLATAAGLLLGCATRLGPDGRVDPDPYARSNRAVFRFNDAVDRGLLDPVATGWRFISPEILREALDRAFKNLEYPVRLLSNLGQGQLRGAGSETARFLVNSSVGIAGLFDPASAVGLGRYDEDFGQMFGRWGAPSGAYWVIPVLGPSNPRDAIALLFDTALDLATVAGVLLQVNGVGAVQQLNSLAISNPMELARENALDPYVFVRDAYIQRRDAQIRNVDLEDGEAEAAEDPYDGEDDLYELDEELEEEPDAGEDEPEATDSGKAPDGSGIAAPGDA